MFHYASLEQTLPREFGPRQAFGFHARLAQCVDAAKLPANSRALEPDLAQQATCDLPLLIREHERKYHFSVAQTSIWTRLAD